MKASDISLDIGKLSEKQLVELQKKYEQQAAMNPYWYFKPNTGVITPELKQFMAEFLKPEDIPDGRVDGQEDIFKSNADVILAFGGNQVGKTTAAILIALIWAGVEIPPSVKNFLPPDMVPLEFPQYIRLVSIDYKTLFNTVIPALQYWTPKEYLKNGKWGDSYSSEHRTLYLYSPLKKNELIGTIELMTNQMDIDSFGGPPRHGVIYDEEPKEAIYQENNKRFITAKRRKILFSMTPVKGMTWIYDKLITRSDENDKIDIFRIPSCTNRKANLKVLREVLREEDTYEAVKMRLLGEMVSLSGLVYGNLFSNVHIKEPFFESLDQFKKQLYVTLVGLDPHTVTSTAIVFVLVDREGNCYVDRCIKGQWDTDEIKFNFWKTVKQSGYRLGWSVADKSSNSSIIAFGGRNIFRELQQPTRDKFGQIAIKGIHALRTSEKYEGSIRAGVDEIKTRLRPPERLFVINRPENAELIKSFKTLERDTYINADKMGDKDRIVEGKHHMHAALRYVFQFPIHWYPPVDRQEYVELNEALL